MEGSRAVYGAQTRASRLAGLPRLCRDPSISPEDGARSLHFGRDDRHIRCTFVQRGGSDGPVKHLTRGRLGGGSLGLGIL